MLNGFHPVIHWRTMILFVALPTGQSRHHGACLWPSLRLSGVIVAFNRTSSFRKSETTWKSHLLLSYVASSRCDFASKVFSCSRRYLRMFNCWGPLVQGYFPFLESPTGLTRNSADIRVIIEHRALDSALTSIAETMCTRHCNSRRSCCPRSAQVSDRSSLWSVVELLLSWTNLWWYRLFHPF